jgi:hypothetical protein
MTRDGSMNSCAFICIQSSKGSRHITFLAIMLPSWLWQSVLTNVITVRKVSCFDVARVLEPHRFYYVRDLEVSSDSSTPIFPFTTQVLLHGCMHTFRNAAIRAPSTTACYTLANQSCQYEIRAKMARMREREIWKWLEVCPFRLCFSRYWNIPF